MTEDVLYLEVDEDITSAIDKLTKSKASQVTIVAPKRSTLIQSLINLKLLKKAADDAGKSIVLVTGDRTATHMAGRLGLAVAATLKGKPSVPETPNSEPSDATEIIEDGDDDEEGDEVSNAAAAASSLMPAASQPVATPKVTRRSLLSVKSLAAEGAGDPTEADLNSEITAGLGAPILAEKAKKPKAPRVPNFQSMQQKVMLGVGVVALIIALIGINIYIAKATVTLYAKGTEVNTQFKFTLDPTARQSDIAKNTIIAQSLVATHTLTASVTATGKKDVGTKASGQMTVSNAYDAAPHTIPAGTKFVASNKIFTSETEVIVPGATAVIDKGIIKLIPGKSSPFTVAASDSGDSYNLGPATYTISGQPAQISGQGGQMSGGTSKQVDVITQADVDTAKQAALDKDKDGSLKELQAKVATDYSSLEATFTQKVGEVTASPAVDAQASTSTATIKVDYSLLAYNKTDLGSLAHHEQEKQLGEGSQIYDDGAGEAKIGGPATPGALELTYQTTAYAGSKLDKDKIAASLSGKRYGDAADLAGKLPGVEKVEITLWPSWASTIPRILTHITINIKVAPRG